MLAAAPALRNGLFWDDAIVLTRQVPVMGGLRGAFFPPRGLPQFIPSYYRPVVFLTLLLDRAVWGTHPFGFHFDVWLLQALTAGLFFLLMRHLVADRSRAGHPIEDRGATGSGDGWSALAAGLVFAVHPVHAEAVAWIMGRADVLAAFFTVVALLAVARMAGDRAGEGTGAGTAAASTAAVAAPSTSKGLLALALTAGLASALALLSKESAIVLPALAAIVLAATNLDTHASRDRPTPSRRDSARTAAAAIGAISGGIALALVLRVLARTGEPSAPVMDAAPLSATLARLSGALVFSLGRLVWPWPAPVFHAQVPAVGPAGALGALLFAALVAAAWASSRSGRAAALFTGAALLPVFAPAATRISLSPVADRYLYIPSLGACWMAGAVLSRGLAALRERRGATGGAPALLLAPLLLGMAIAAGTTYRAVASYRDDATFWSAALERSPSDPFVVMKHGQYLADAGRFGEAEAELRRALTLGGVSLRRSTRTIILDNLADIALRQGRLDEARPWLDRALDAGPGYAPAHLHLARWYRARALADATDPSEASKGRAAEESRLAAASVDRAIELEPTSTEALLLRADLALDRGDKPAAIAAIREALRYMPAGADRARIEAALRSLGG